MHCVDLAEVHAFGSVLLEILKPFGSVTRDFKTIFHRPFWYFVDALLHFSFYGSHIFGAVTNEEDI